MEPSWLETYYTALEFFYWEPQHLGLKKNQDTKLDSRDKSLNDSGHSKLR